VEERKGFHDKRVSTKFLLLLKEEEERVEHLQIEHERRQNERSGSI
jgi:hypothetical protein